MDIGLFLIVQLELFALLSLFYFAGECNQKTIINIFGLFKQQNSLNGKIISKLEKFILEVQRKSTVPKPVKKRKNAKRRKVK